MDALLESIVDLLGYILPKTLDLYVLQGAAAIAVLLAIIKATRRFFSRKKIYIEQFDTNEHDNIDTCSIRQSITGNINRIWETHSEKSLTAAGYISSINDLQHVNEGITDRVEAIADKGTPLMSFADAFAKLSNLIWPRVYVKGEIIRQDKEYKCSARLVKGDRVVALWIESEKGEYKDAIPRLIEKMSYLIALGVINKGVIATGSSEAYLRNLAPRFSRGPRKNSTRFAVGTENWEAFRDHTNALDRWQSHNFDAENDNHIKLIEDLLQSSIQHDPNYAMAHFNLGILKYHSHKGASVNESASVHFRTAIELIDKIDGGRGACDSTGLCVKGLAYVGLARCYCQYRHRYGYLDTETVNNARSNAEEAVKLLKGDVKALHALAFAWHCTETIDDIRKGRAIYEQVIRKEPNKDSHVHNNLGYILMVGGKLIGKAGNKKEGEKWFRDAEHHMKTVLEIERGRSTRMVDFAHANLGNLCRLRGEYERAVSYYLKALDYSPEESTYTNGLNELSLVYFETGDYSEALHYHELALRTTKDRNHQLKLAKQVVEVIAESGHPGGTSVSDIYTAVSTTGNEFDVARWLKGIDEGLSANTLTAAGVSHLSLGA